MHSGRTLQALAVYSTIVLLAACSNAPLHKPETSPIQHPTDISKTGNEVAIYALSLINTDYRFGGKNPEAGLDCSGMVSYIFKQAAGMTLTGSAADIARQGRQIDRTHLRTGDLVFFNTQNRPFSHVGVYIGDNRFVHTPSSNGKIRIARMDNPYFAQRFEMARTYF